MAELRIYLHLLRAQVRSQSAYRASFVLDLLFSAVLSATEVSIVLVLFAVRPSLGGFALGEVLLMAGITSVAFGLADLAVGSVERIGRYVREGLLDAVLVRPLAALPQLLVTDFAPRRAGWLVVSLATFGTGLHLAHVRWTAATALLAVTAPLAGAVLFASVFVTTSALAFWLVEAGEVGNAVTYGGREFGTYPANLFGGWFRRLFSYGLGLAFVGYLPALALTGRREPMGLPGWLGWCSPLVAAAWAAVARFAWGSGIRHYRSTGS